MEYEDNSCTGKMEKYIRNNEIQNWDILALQGMRWKEKESDMEKYTLFCGPAGNKKKWNGSSFMIYIKLNESVMEFKTISRRMSYILKTYFLIYICIFVHI